MNKLKYMAGVVITAMAISSCGEDTETLGNSLTNESDKLDVSTKIFNATTRTILSDSVLTDAAYGYFGRVIDPETSAEVRSEFMTQFHVIEDLYIRKEYVYNEDNGTIGTDPVCSSCDLVLYVSNPFRGATNLTAMQMNVRELQTPVSETKAYYSNFDPSPLLRSDANALNISHVFTYSNMTDTDSARSSSTYLNNIRIPLEQPYISRDNITYKNYGTYILKKLIDYHNQHNRYPNSFVFARDICPGLFFELSDGYGFHSAISNIGLRLFFTIKRPDTTYQASVVLAGTGEVMQTVRILNDKEKLANLAKDNDHTYLKTPAGLFTEVTLPVLDVWKGHENDSLLATKMIFQRIHNDKADAQTFNIPPTLLMVMKDSLYTFFEKKHVPNSRTSFLTNYNSNYNTYTFTNISQLVTHMWKMREKNVTTDPTWNDPASDHYKVVLVPIVYGTSTTSSSPIWVGHNLALTSTRLVGGKTPIEMNVVYAKFKK